MAVTEPSYSLASVLDRLSSTDATSSARRFSSRSAWPSRRLIVTLDSSPPARSASTGAAALVTGSTGAALTGAKWSHNNSTMRVESQGGTMRVLYDQPKSGLAGLGIAPGTPLFDGKKTGANSYAGEATTFSKSCGPAKFQVAGDLSGDGRRLVLRGQKPERGSNCQVSGYRPETLSFEVAR